MKSCKSCRFWSEMCAQSIGCGPMKALCLSKDGPKKGRMTEEDDMCEKWKHNNFGAMDDPSGEWKKYEFFNI